MKKYLIGALVIVLLIGGIVIFRNNRKQTVVTPISVSGISLPANWASADNSGSKFEKKVDSGIKPMITVSTTTSKDALTPAKYTDRLIAGARSAIPSLKFADDLRNSAESKYTAFLSGSYTNKKQLISVRQRVYISGESVTVMTASYTGSLEQEVDTIFDSLASKNSL